MNIIIDVVFVIIGALIYYYGPPKIKKHTRKK